MALPRTGSPVDRELALVELFARSQKLNLLYVPVTQRSQLIESLLAGQGDMIAAHLTHTAQRSQRVHFSEPIRHVSEQLVTAKRARRVPSTPSSLANREVWLRPTASFVGTVDHLAKSLNKPIHIKSITEAIGTDELLYRVGTGRYPLSVVDSDALEAYRGYRNDVIVAQTLKTDVPIAWAVHPQNGALLTKLNQFIKYNVNSRSMTDALKGDLDAIRARGRLRVAMPNNATSYFLHGGMPIGYQYRLAKLFAKQLGLRLEVISPRRQMDLISLVTKGYADVLAATLTVTPERRRSVNFSVPLSVVDEVLVQRAVDTPVSSRAQLAGQVIHVRRSSAYWQTLKALQREVPALKIQAVPETLETESLIAQVLNGQIPMTVADFDILAVEMLFSNALKTSLTLKKGVQRAYAVRKNSPRLLAAINRFVTNELAKKSTRRFAPVARAHRTSNFSPPSQSDSSATTHTPFEQMATAAGRATGIAPKLLLAVAKVASGFSPHTRSQLGELGLLQLMPHIVGQVGRSNANLLDPNDNLRVGAQYLALLMQRFDSALDGSVRRQFALAAFKVGPGHLDDARRLAREELKLDPNRWKGHVDKALMLLSQSLYAEKARNGYCRGAAAVRFVHQVEQVFAQR